MAFISQRSKLERGHLARRAFKRSEKMRDTLDLIET
jgi:hypothetical protein